MVFTPSVLQVVPEMEEGGAERTTLEIAQALVSAGGRALVATHGGRMVAALEEAGAQVISMPVHSKNPVQMWRNAGALARLIGQEHIDIIHARSRAPAWSSLWAARRADIAYVATYHGAYRAKTALKRFYNSSLVRADAVIANSDFTRASIAAQFPKARARLHTIPRGAKLDEFDPARVGPERVSTLASQWGLASRQDQLKILVPGRLTEWKGQMDCIEALIMLASRQRKLGMASSSQNSLFTVVFCGDAQGRAEYERDLRDRVRIGGVQEMVNFVGHCADMPAAYSWADLVLTPSRRPEAFGRVVAEAGAMERPVVACDHGGAREIIADDRTGFLVPPKSPSAIVSAISTFTEMDDAQRQRMGKRARQRVAAQFSVDAMCAHTLEVYQAVKPPSTKVKEA